MIFAALTFATLVTSFISGVLSMAGGTILMGVFGFFLSVPAAMVLHGIAQAFSNGSRVWLYRHDIRWRVLIPYTLGALLVTGLFFTFTFVPDVGLVFILIGSFPLLALIMPRSIDLDMMKPHIALTSGITVTLAQLLAGASGPVLDIFYIKSSLTRQEILGTKAVTQTLGHLLKLAYYGTFLLVASEEIALWAVPAIVAAAIIGNWLGSLVINRISDDSFRRAGRYVIVVIGLVYFSNGCYELFVA